MRFIFLALILSSAGSQIIYAQSLTPADIQRQKEHKAYQDAYLEGIRTADYRPKTYSGGADPKVAQELADLFAARAGKKTSAQKKAEEEAATKKYYDDLKQKQDAFDKRLDFNLFVSKNYREPIKFDYLNVGFDAIEARNYSYEEVKSDNGYLELKPNPAYFRAKGLLLQLKNIEATAPFPDVMALILELQATPAPVTSLAALQRLVKRFPEKIDVIHAAMGKSFRPYFFDWREKPGDVSAGKKGKQKNVLWSEPEGTLKYMLESYEAYLTYDTPSALAAFKNIHLLEDQPIVTLAFIAEVHKDKKRVGELCRILLLSPNPDDKTLLSAKEYRDNAYRRIYQISKHNYTYNLGQYYNRFPDGVLAPYSADEVRQIAAAQGLKPIDVIQAITDTQAYSRFSAGGKLSKEEKKYWKLDELLKELAAGGDADAKLFLATQK
ncbi:hypothetical protein GCM10023185_36310 [Hymenobacter saemangeumensis]|uniref:DUF885 domain-containing protein n=1 Tax=Hymenobacter saemangeumensis TaxID=1084522 RepID=A0ABP8IPW2_9BACT